MRLKQEKPHLRLLKKVARIINPLLSSLQSHCCVNSCLTGLIIKREREALDIRENYFIFFLTLHSVAIIVALIKEQQ